MAEAESIIGTPDIPDAEGAAEDGAADRADDRGEETAPGRGKRRIMVLFAVAVFAYLIDLISKMLVVAKLEHHAPVEIFGDWLQLSAIRNAGAAFGIGEAYTVIFTCIAATVIVVIARLARKLYSLPWAIALGLLLGVRSATSPTASSGPRAPSRARWSTSSLPRTSPSSTSPTPRSAAAAF